MPEISGLYLQREGGGQTAGRGERRERAFTERKINILLDFVVLISEMIDYSVCCMLKPKCYLCLI